MMRKSPYDLREMHDLISDAEDKRIERAKRNYQEEVRGRLRSSPYDLRNIAPIIKKSYVVLKARGKN